PIKLVATCRLVHDAHSPPLHHTFHPNYKRTCRKDQCREIVLNELIFVRKSHCDQLETMMAWLTKELNSARWRRSASKGGTMRVGLRGFLFKESRTTGLGVGGEKKAAGRRGE